MKVNIEKEGKTQKYKVISSWEEVTLEKWVKLAELEGLSKSEEAEGIIAEFSNIPNTLIKQLALSDVAAILNRVTELQDEKDSSLKQIIEVDGKEYGFHPQLSDITLGEYADIETFIKNGVQENLPEIMSVLYRPIVEKEGDAYIIEAYDSNIDIRAEKFKKMKAENVESALVFFWIFASIVFSRTLPSSLMEQMQETSKNLEGKITQTDGDGLE